MCSLAVKTLNSESGGLVVQASLVALLVSLDKEP